MKKILCGIVQRTCGRDSNSSYFLSNGNNWLDAGGGNDLLISGSALRSKMNDAKWVVLSGRIKCEAANDIKGRMAA